MNRRVYIFSLLKGPLVETLDGGLCCIEAGNRIRFIMTTDTDLTYSCGDPISYTENKIILQQVRI